MTPTLSSFSPRPRSLEHLGLGPSGLEATVENALRQPPPAAWRPSEVTRELYLDLAESIVRAAAPWQDARGALIDPFAGRECGQASPRFTAPGAILLACGRLADLRESVFLAMDWCCASLADKRADSPDFWMRELATAFPLLAPLTTSGRVDQWRRNLGRVEPENTYKYVSVDGARLSELHNWSVYAAAGEWLREHAGLGPPAETAVWGRSFFDKYMGPQRCHFTAHGMYRDPGDPITYDITTRLQIATALAFGYDGPLRADYDELLRRGGLALLLLVSAEGYVPYGGRSSQFQFQEAIVAALCELEARRYQTSHPRLAGAFKRQARLAAQSTRRWLTGMTPLRHIKNGFPPADSWGRDTYGHYSIYSLLTASFFGLAALFADDTIPEAPAPAETGAYLLNLGVATPAAAPAGAFHKIIATCGGSQLVIDTRADRLYDATGLGRFLGRGVPVELGPGMPFSATPHFMLPEAYRPPLPLAVGPAWESTALTADGTPGATRWVRLAELSADLTACVKMDRTDPGTLAFTVTYQHAPTCIAVAESYSLTEGRLAIRTTVCRENEPVPRIRYLVPLLDTDGEVTSVIRLAPGQASVRYRGAELRVDFQAHVHAVLELAPIGNRNGLYQCLVLEAESGEVELSLTLAPSA